MVIPTQQTLLEQDFNRQEQRLNEALHSYSASLHAEQQGALQTLREEVLSIFRVLSKLDPLASASWDDASWARLTPRADRATVPPLIRIGTLRLILTLSAQHRVPITVPAMIPLLCRNGLILPAHDLTIASYRELLQSVAIRLLATMPPGHVRLCLFDPAGLGRNFSQLMQFPEYVRGQLVRHSSSQIAEELNRLTEHISTVIQRKLTNKFQNLHAYNNWASHDHQPYYVVIVSDFPAGFESRAAEQLLNIAMNGPRAGVHVLMTLDQARELPRKFPLEQLMATSAAMQRGRGAVVQFPDWEFLPDPLPLNSIVNAVTEILQKGIGRAQRIALPIESVSTKNLYNDNTKDGLACSLGLNGTEPLLLEIGRKDGMHHHVLVGGASGTGKSTLLHTLILGLCSRYSPEELELYLVDFKEGVEFSIYRNLPHARLVAIESEREFGISVLRGLKQEMSNRGDLFRNAGPSIDSLRSYRDKTGRPCPRILLIIDEFQLFFERSDRIANEARILLDDLVCRGRGFGIHVMLASQSVPSGELNATTLAQLGIRIALRVHSEDDSYKILARDNPAARYLEHQGQAIFNSHSGRPDGNMPFLVAYLPPLKREERIRQLIEKIRDSNSESLRMPFVYEGNRPSSVISNPSLWGPDSTEKRVLRAIPAFLGEPAQLQAEHTRFLLRRQSRSHLLVCGQAELTALRVFLSACTSFLGYAQSSDSNPRKLFLLDLSNANSAVNGQLDVLGKAQGVKIGGRRQIHVFLTKVVDELNARAAADDLGQKAGAPWILGIFGLQGASILSRQGPRSCPEREALLRILAEGADLGLHLLVWANTYSKLMDCLDTRSLQEFDGRVALSGGDAEKIMGQLSQVPMIKPDSGLLWNQDSGDSFERFRCYGDIAETIQQREINDGTNSSRSG